MSHSGSPFIAGVPDYVCLGMDTVRVVQICVCLVEPVGVADFGSTEHFPELLRVQKEHNLFFSMVQCALMACLAPLCPANR